jgi:hypothetical protein
MITPDCPATWTPDCRPKTTAQLRAAFCLPATTKLRPNTQPKNTGVRPLTTDVKRHWRQPGSDLTCGYTDRPERLSCSTLLTDHSTPCRHPWEVIRPVVSGGTEDAKARNKGDHDCRLIRLPSRAKPDGSSATYPSGLALEGSRESVQRRSALFVFLHRVSKPGKDCLYIQYIRVTFREKARKPYAINPPL